jgi:molybdopterin molybdotransferase
MIYDSNSWTLAARVRELGGEAHVAERAADDPAEIAAALEKLLEGRDLVITAGGISVGERDFMPQAGEKLGAGMLFHGVALRPGGAAMALEKNGKLLICLSGNPFAAYATFELLAVPVLKKLGGEKTYRSPKAKGVMANNFDRPSEVRRFMRARIEGERIFVPEKGHFPGMLSSLTGCNCLADVPAGTPRLARGDVVDVVPFASDR